MKKYVFILLLTLLAVLAGLWGGLTATSLTQKGSSLTLLSPELDLSGQKNIIINDARRVVVNQDLAVQELAFNLSSSLVGIFRQGSASQNLLDSYYYPEKVSFVAWPVSSDGWLLLNQNSNSEAVADLAVNYQNFRALIRNRNQVYEIDKVYIPKNNQAFVLVHLQGVNDLPVREFASPLDLSSGQMLLQTSFTGEMAVNYLGNSILGAKVRSSEPVNRRVDTLWPIEKDLASFVFSLDGFLVSFRGLDGNLVLAHDYYPALKEFFRQESLARPVLGLSYYELSSLAKKDPESRLVRKGAYLTAVVKNSLADQAGLKVADVIISLNSKELGEANDLGEMLKNYKNGDKLSFKYLRAGETLETNIIFKNN